MTTEQIERDVPFCSDVSEVVLPLRQSLSALIGSAPRRDKQSSLMGRLNATLQSRLSRAIEAESDLAAMYYLPGPDGLRRVLSVARRSNGNSELLKQVQRQIDHYEQFLEREEIGRERLHAVLGGFMPKVRDSMVRSNGQSVFKAMSNIIGYYAETMVTTLIVTPGTNPDRCNLTSVGGFYNWRRLRHDAWFLVTGIDPGPQEQGDFKATTLEGVNLADLQQPPVIEELCRNTPEFALNAVQDNVRHYKVAGSEISARSVCDFFLGEVLWNTEDRWQKSEGAVAITGAGIATPSKHLLFDTLIHKDVWQGIKPHLECYRVVPQGIVNRENWVKRQHDRLDLGVSLRTHAPGLPAIHSTTAPRHSELIDYALQRMDIDAGDMAGYRCAVQYPLYGTQYCMRFELPPKL